MLSILSVNDLLDQLVSTVEQWPWLPMEYWNVNRFWRDICWIWFDKMVFSGNQPLVTNHRWRLELIKDFLKCQCFDFVTQGSWGRWWLALLKGPLPPKCFRRNWYFVPKRWGGGGAAGHPFWSNLLSKLTTIIIIFHSTVHRCDEIHTTKMGEGGTVPQNRQVGA